MLSKKSAISKGVVHSQIPENSTVFDSTEAAEDAAKLLVGPGLKYRAEPLNGRIVVRIWPEGKSPICGARRWLKIKTPKPRKKNGTEED